MEKTLYEKVKEICKKHNIDALDISIIKKMALKNNQYDVFVYLNNNPVEYLKKEKENSPQ